MYINYNSIIKAKLNKEPFKYFVIKDFVNKDYVKDLSKEFPNIETSGSIPLSSLNYKAKFNEFVKELEGDEFREVMARNLMLI